MPYFGYFIKQKMIDPCSSYNGPISIGLRGYVYYDACIRVGYITCVCVGGGGLGKKYLQGVGEYWLGE